MLRWPVQGANSQGVNELLPAPMTTTSNASIATTEVLVSPKGEMIAVAPLTNEKGSLLSSCATPCSNSPSLSSHSAPPPPARSLLVTQVAPNPNHRSVLFTLAPLCTRSGQPVKTDAAKYVTHHDAKGVVNNCDAGIVTQVS